MGELEIKTHKMLFVSVEGRFFGHVVVWPVEPDHEKISCFENLKLESANFVSKFFGFLNFNHKFVYGYADIARSLVELTPKNIPLLMTPKYEHAFAIQWRRNSRCIRCSFYRLTTVNTLGLIYSCDCDARAMLR
jgi:hypothetical protein